MTLSAGTRLGPYEILATLGAGGMGEVHRARDSKLGRDVAIKVLPQSVAADPERVARFEPEAKTLAALNHPNIAAVYGFEESDASPPDSGGRLIRDRIRPGLLRLDKPRRVSRVVVPNGGIVRAQACLAVLLAVCLAPGLALAQTTGAPARTSTVGVWTPPRTADGQPDLQGVWLIHTATPLQRPKEFEGRARLTDEEVAEFRRRADRLFKTGDGDFSVGDGVFQALLSNPGRYTNPNATGGADGMIDLEIDNRTSLIVDPADGRIPPLTEAGRRRQEATAAAFARPETPADVGNPLRCLSWGVPRLGGRYGSGDMSYYQIFQSPGYVVLFMEAGHEARTIPLDGRPHLAPALRQWSGDSRGRWDGDTLVVETTNFSRNSYFMGSTENLHLVERFTRVAPDTITYEMTLTDPTTWARPWTATMPMKARQETLYESACHEGNYPVMSGMIVGARVQRDAETAEQAKP